MLLFIVQARVICLRQVRTIVVYTPVILIHSLFVLLYVLFRMYRRKKRKVGKGCVENDNREISLQVALFDAPFSCEMDNLVIVGFILRCIYVVMYLNFQIRGSF